MPERQLELLGRESCARGAPVLRGELEVPVAVPVRQDADDLGEVQLGVESVELGRGDQREGVAGGPGVVVGPIEQPCPAPDGDGLQLAFSGIVLHAEPTVVEKAAERFLVANGVSEGGGDEPAFVAFFVLCAGPGEEGVDERAHGLVALRLALNRREFRERPVGVEDGVNEAYTVEAERVLADGGFPVLAARMRLIRSAG